MPPKPPARLREGRAFTSLGLAAGLVVPAALFGGPVAIAVPVTAPPATAPGTSAAAPGTSATVGAGPQSDCGDPGAEDFPIETRIHGGPATYASGGGYGTWYLDLTNTTSEPCHAIHPVLVLTDEDRRLTSEQVQLEFSERANPDEEHRVTWETTDRDEQIGVFGEGDAEAGEAFPGFTVPAKGTVTVEVRMAFTSDTLPGEVTANAAIVQRRTANDERGEKGAKPDGDWVGESADYRFAIVEGRADGGTDVETDGGVAPDADAETDTEAGPGTDAGTGADVGPGTDADTGTDGTGTDAGTGSSTIPGTEPGRTPPGTEPGTGTGTGSPADRPELSGTGQALTPWVSFAAGAGLLLLGGLAAVWRTRRARRGHR